MTAIEPGLGPHHPDVIPAAADLEGKIPRALAALGVGAGRAVALVDGPGAPWLPALRQVGADPLVVELAAPLRIQAPNTSLDLVVTLFSGFRGVEWADLAEVDRVLRPGGRLLVVHAYGRDDVSALHDEGAPEYRLWSRREGPFLRGGGFKIRVVHCFWTFPDLDEARATLVAAFGERGEGVAARLKRPRLSWNVAIYHRWRGGVAPAGATDDEAEPPA